MTTLEDAYRTHRENMDNPPSPPPVPAPVAVDDALSESSAAEQPRWQKGSGINPYTEKKIGANGTATMDDALEFGRATASVVVGGVRDAAQNFVGVMNDLATWTRELGIPLPAYDLVSGKLLSAEEALKQSQRGLRFQQYRENDPEQPESIAKIREQVRGVPQLWDPIPLPPDAGGVETFGRGIVAFMAPFFATGGAGGATIPARLLAATRSGAFADALADPVQGTMVAALSELKESSGIDLVPDVLEFLNVKAGDDATASQRLKIRLVQAGEGSVIGVLADGLFETFRAIKGNPELRQKILENFSKGWKKVSPTLAERKPGESFPAALSIKQVGLDADEIMSVISDYGTNVLETEFTATGVSAVKVVSKYGNDKKVRKNFRPGVTKDEVVAWLGDTAYRPKVKKDATPAVKSGAAPAPIASPAEQSPAMVKAIEEGDFTDVIRVMTDEAQLADTHKASRGLAKLPDQTAAKGDPNIAPGVAKQFDDRLDQDGVHFMKWVRNNQKGKFLHQNQKTAASVDFSTTCGKRSCNTGSCLYCYVDEGRVINKERDKAIAAGGTVKDTGLGSAQAKTDKLEHNFDPEIFNKMPKSVIDAFNQDGGLRMFSFGDYRDGIDNANVKATLDAALERGINIKAITKSEEFVEQFGDHPALRLNVSMDKVPTDVSNAWTAEKAIAAKQRYPNLRIRSVALNEKEIDEFGKMTMPDGSPLIDVITLYHGKTNFTPKGERTDKLSKVVLAKLNDPEFTPPEGRQQILDQFGGEDGLKAYLDTWKNMTPKGAAHKHARETYKNRVCCTNGKCSADPGTKCGFGVIKEAPLNIIALLLGSAAAAYPELAEPEV